MTLRELIAQSTGIRPDQTVLDMTRRTLDFEIEIENKSSECAGHCACFIASNNLLFTRNMADKKITLSVISNNKEENNL